MTTGPDTATSFASGLVALQTDLPIPAWGFGIIAFVLLVGMMTVVLSIGGGRPHS